MAPHDLMEVLALVCCTAALTAVLCHRLRQPVVLGYLLAGVLVGPHVAVFFDADEAQVRVLSELGVTLLMFSIGLDFSLRRFVRLLPSAGVMVALGVPLMFGAGFLVGESFGWSTLESVFAGAMLVVSSSMLLERSLRDSIQTPAFRDRVLGVTIVEDMVAVLLLAVLTAVASGSSVSGGEVTGTLVRLAGFLAAIVVIGLLLVPRVVRAIARVASPEVSVVAAVGLCFAFSWVARAAGYSVALGAFLAGMLVAESGAGRRIGEMIAPLRDVFTAVFFVSVGMLLEPALVVENLGAVIALVLVVLVGRAGALAIGAFLVGSSIRDSVRAGLLLAQIGEFSFLIAALGVQSGAVGSFLYPVSVTVAVLVALFNPWLVRASPSIAATIERRLPERLRTFASLYASWLESSRGRRDSSLPRRRLLRLGLWLGVDLALFCGVVLSAAIWYEEIARLVIGRLGLGLSSTRAAVVACAALASLPFALGALRLSQRMGTLVAESALPLPPPTRPDPGYTPRRALAVALQLGLVLVCGLCAQAITQPFVPPLGGFVVLFFVLATLAISFWRRADELEGHVQAGAQVIASALTRTSGRQAALSIEVLESLLPGIGHLAMLGLGAQAEAVGRELGELELSAKTGATVVAIERDGKVIAQPEDSTVLRGGDVIALSGSQEAVRDAALLLARPRAAAVQDLRSVRST